MVATADRDRKTLRRWRRDPVAFFREVYGVDLEAWPWDEPDQRPYQAEILQSVVENRETYVATGNCMAPGTMIRMWDGSVKAVEDVQVGDELVGDDAQPRTVRRLFSGLDPMYRFRYSCGIEHVYTGNHRLALMHVAGWLPTRYKIRQPTVEEYLGEWTPNKRRVHPGYTVAFPGVEADLPIPPYILGIWLGDGCKNTSDFCTIDEEIRDELRSYGQTLGIGLSVRPNGRNTMLTTGVRFKRNPWLAELRAAGLFGRKYIPDEYHRASEAQRLELLAGLIDSDGSLSASGSTYEIVQKRRDLAVGIQRLARGLGFRARLVEKYVDTTFEGGTRTRGIYYRVFIGGSISRVPVRLDRKRSERTMTHAQTLKIDSVEPLGVGAYYGFEVDGNHRFLSAEGVVLLNSVGKDFLMGRVVPWWMSTRLGARVMTTAVKEPQITVVLWSELRAGYAAAAKRGIHLGGDLRPAAPLWEIKGKDGDLIGRAMGQVGKDENAFQGIHGPNVLVIGDEAAGLSKWVEEAADGMAVGPRDRIVWIGNPTCAPDHWFAKNSMSPDVPGKKKTIRVRGDETPNYVQGREVIPGLQTVEGVEAIVRKNGANSAVTNARVKAMFPVQGADSLIGYQHIGPARERWNDGVRAKPEDLCRAGGDVARKGDDLTAFAWVKGPEAHADMDDTRAGYLQPQVTDFFGNRMREIGASGISIDGGAMGPGPIDYLQKDLALYHLHRDTAVIEVLFGAKAYDEEQYADRRTELWFTMRDWLQNSGSMEIDEALEEELLAPTFTYVGARYKLEPKDKTKERLGRSPDRADALALAIGGHVGAPTSLVLAHAGEPDPEPQRDLHWKDRDDDVEPAGEWEGMGPSGVDSW